ncbi:MAG TPA: type IV secretory system conjugative DNA transfer family protein [Pseudonocardiaceae bacterium]|jgi:hypothetical protein|nr:type IV secretory system conjugative DNA transfer family protein [Pseudonocardiaceae bacterium]
MRPASNRAGATTERRFISETNSFTSAAATGVDFMSSLVWFDLYLPPGLTLADATKVIRPLAGRAPSGLVKRTPLVVFEVWSHGGAVRWLLGTDQRLTATLPDQLRAQLPGLTLVRTAKPRRRLPDVTATAHTSGVTQPLRTEMAAAVSSGVLSAMNALRKRESAVVQFVVGPSQQRKTPPETFSLTRSLGFRPSPPPSARERNVWQHKTSEPLFAVRCRVAARAPGAARAKAVIGILGDALGLASASYTELRLRRPARSHARSQSFIQAAGSSWSALLNATELAALLGWPLDGTVSPSLGRPTYPAPPALLVPVNQKHPALAERVVGTSLHPADAEQLVAVPTPTWLRHAHVTGVTGTGKSTLLTGFARADIAAGHGLLVVEPRGDLVADVLAGIPASRRDDVVLIEPGLSDQVVGFNPLSGAPGDAERRADDILHLFHELYPGIGPRSSDVLLHALIALARKPDGTLVDLPVLLTNGQFRRQVLSEVTDPLVLAPFFSWYDGLSEAERSQVIAPVLNKTRALLSRSAIRRLLGQPTPRFQLDELFTERRIVLVNLNAGHIGAQTAQLIGALLMTQLWQAIQRRAGQPARQRHPVMVMVDEVQQYLKLPVDIGEMLAQARGLGVSLTLAHQHLGQLTPSLRAALQANARTKIVFKPSSDDRDALVKALGSGLNAGALEQLGAFEAYVRVLVDGAMSEPFLLRTRPLEPAISQANDLRLSALQRYGVDGRDLDALHQQRWHGQRNQPDGPIGIRRRRGAS